MLANFRRGLAFDGRSRQPFLLGGSGVALGSSALLR